MKTTLPILTLTAVQFLAALPSSHAQMWQTVYEGPHATPPNTSIHDFATDAFGSIVALERVYDPVTGSGNSAVVMSADAGASWVRSAVFPGSYQNVALSDSGDLFLSSGALAPSGPIWRSTDAGVTWQPTWATPGGGVDGDNSVHDLASGSGGVIYAAAEIKPRWLLVKGVPSATGMSWSIVDNYHPDSKRTCEPLRISVRRGTGIGGADEIYVGGFETHQRNGSFFLVRKSADGGTTWTTVMAYQIVPGAFGIGAGVKEMALSPGGTIYVGGYIPVSKTKVGRDTTVEMGNLLRKSTDGGLTWSNVLQTDRFIRGLAVGPDGRVYMGTLSLPTEEKFLEISANGGASWSVSDPLGVGSVGPTVTIDSVGNAYSGGNVYQGGTGSTYSAYSLIRRLSAPAP